jgi:hypothetical protein
MSVSKHLSRNHLQFCGRGDPWLPYPKLFSTWYLCTVYV